MAVVAESLFGFHAGRGYLHSSAPDNEVAGSEPTKRPRRLPDGNRLCCQHITPEIEDAELPTLTLAFDLARPYGMRLSYGFSILLASSDND
jgi:hypothetical protein